MVYPDLKKAGFDIVEGKFKHKTLILLKRLLFLPKTYFQCKHKTLQSLSIVIRISVD